MVFMPVNKIYHIHGSYGHICNFSHKGFHIPCLGEVIFSREIIHITTQGKSSAQKCQTVEQYWQYVNSQESNSTRNAVDVSKNDLGAG